MEKEAKTWSVQKLRATFRRINFPAYQREPNVWSRDAKQRLVDSMVRRFDIASIYIYADEHESMDCVDGRQRLGAIMSFLGQNPNDEDNKFEFRILNEVYDDEEHPLRSMHNKTYEEITRLADKDQDAKEFVRRFREYPLTVILLSDSETDKEFNLQFARLNLGTIINSGEKLHAMVGALRDTCFSELGRHPFLAETNVPTRRYSREQLAAQIIGQVFALETSKRVGRREYGRTRHFDLQRLFKQHTVIGDEQRQWIDKITRIMSRLQPRFVEMGALRNRAIVVSTVLLAYEDNADSEQDARTIAEFVDEFVRCLKWQMVKGFDMDEEYRYLVQFQRHVTQASVEKPAVEGRARTLKEGLAHWRERRMLRGDDEYLANHPGSNPAEDRRG